MLPLADLLGVDGAICSRGEVDEQGRYTGRMAFYAYGESKATAMRELAERTGLDLGASSAYSDSATDLPMLEAVGRPVAVNPDRAWPRWHASAAGRCATSPSRSACATGSGARRRS